MKDKYDENEWAISFRRFRELINPDFECPQEEKQTFLNETEYHLGKIYEAFEIAQKVKETMILCGETS